jgi:CheY-like chemotaxis protein
MKNQPVNILLVEDNVMNQFITSKFLKKWNYTVTVANDGKEALKLIEQKCFQLVLMDINMPEMDGYESTRKIREMQGSYFKTIPILAYTASSLINTTTKALESGMTDFINKPVEFEELQEKINQHVIQRNQPQGEGRSFSISLDQYTDGDPGFQSELVSLLIDNIRELEQSFNETLGLDDPKIFIACCHKSSTTLGMLADSQFAFFVEDLKTKLTNQDKNPMEVFHEGSLQFHALCADIVTSLEQVNQLPVLFAA